MRSSRRTPLSRPSRRYRTSFEPLEPRQLLTGAINTAFSFGSPKDDSITGIVVDSNNITYVTGTFTGTITASTGGGNFSLVSNGGTDVFIAAFNGNSLVWANSFGGTGNDVSGGIVLVKTNNVDTLWIDGTFRNSMDADTGTGTTTLLSNGAGDAYLSHFATNGAFINAFSFGGTGEDTALKIAADSAGKQPFLMGTFSGTADLDPSPSNAIFRTANNPNGNIYIIKVAADSAGLIWADTFGYDDSLLPADIAVTPAGIPVFAGTFRGNIDIDGTVNGMVPLSATRFLGFVTVMNANGSFNFVKTFGQPVSGMFDPIRVSSLALDPAGNILLAGKYSGPVNLSTGTIVAGSSTNTVVTTLPELASATGDDAFEGFLLKLNSAGAYLFSGALRGNGASEVLGLTSDSGGSIYITGDLQLTTDFDFSSASHTLTAPALASRSSFIAKYDSLGHWLWVSGATNSTGANFATGIAVTPDFRPVVAGNFTATTAFSTTTTGLTPVVSTTTLTSNGGVDPFILNFLPSTIAPTSVVLTPPTSSITRGNAAHLTITINGVAFPTGTVTFFDGAANLGTFPLPAKENKLTVPLQLLAVGNHTVVARYNGDSNFTSTFSNGVTVTVTVPQTPVGSIDSTGPGVMSGWAADYQALSTPVVIQVFIDNVFRQALVASQERPDLAAFLGSTAHGYTFQVPALTAGDHPVKVIAFDPLTNAGTVIATASLHSDNLYFDEAYYRAHNPDVAAAIKAGKLKSGWIHFITVGAHEGRNPSAYFDEAFYRARNPDVATAIAQGKIASGFAQFNASGAAEGRDPSVFFSQSWYLRDYPDVKSAVDSHALPSAFAHFLLTGMFENRMPTPWFDPAFYTAHNPDVSSGIAAGTIRSAYDHFLNIGLAQVRSPSIWYDENTYLARYPDIGSAVASDALPSGLSHFVNTGFFEGRNSSATFNEAAYLATYPAAQTAIDNGLAKSAFQYFLLFGQLLGQVPVVII